ncbi:hypothetical protein D1872_237750 [compost metagenome]
MLMAMEEAINTSVFFFIMTLLTPSANSARNIRVSRPRFRRLRGLNSSLPVTALTGEMRDAFRAGSREAM